MVKDISYILSHWDVERAVCISGNCVKDLRNYHMMGIRFLYRCYEKQQKGAILNHEVSMNLELQISGFLNALAFTITSKNPVIIICTEETICNWNYHLTNHGGFNVTILSTQNADDILQEGSNHVAILSTVENTIALRKIKAKEYVFIVVDDIDKLIVKNIVKQMKGQLHIGLTHRNFKKNPDQKLFWSILNWANPGVIGKFADFCETDKEHMRNLRDPYNDWWQHLTWKFDDNFISPTVEEVKEYQTKIKDWSIKHKLSVLQIPKSESGCKTRKRKLSKQDLTNIEIGSDVKKTHDSNTAVKDEINIKEEISTIGGSCLNEDEGDSISSNDTIVYDFKESPTNNSSDENHILSSVVSNKKLYIKDCSNIGNESESSSTPNEEIAPNEDDGILTSIIVNEPSPSMNKSKKNDILSLLYGNDV